MQRFFHLGICCRFIPNSFGAFVEVNEMQCYKLMNIDDPHVHLCSYIPHIVALIPLQNSWATLDLLTLIYSIFVQLLLFFFPWTLWILTKLCGLRVQLFSPSVSSCFLSNSSPVMHCWMLDITLISCINREKCFVALKIQFKVMHLQFWPDTLDGVWCIAALVFICNRKYKMPECVSVALRVWSDVYSAAFFTPPNGNCCGPEKWMSALSEQLVTLIDQFSSEKKWKASYSWYRFTAKSADNFWGDRSITRRTFCYYTLAFNDYKPLVCVWSIVGLHCCSRTIAHIL